MSAASDLLSNYQHVIESLTFVTGEKGIFDVIVDGDVVGGIGISSGTPQQDMDCAQAGLDHFETKRG